MELLEIVGGVTALWGTVWALVVAFKEDLFWGLALVFFPPTYVLFVLLRWKRASRPFLMQMAGLAVLFLSVQAPPLYLPPA